MAPLAPVDAPSTSSLFSNLPPIFSLALHAPKTHSHGRILSLRSGSTFCGPYTPHLPFYHLDLSNSQPCASHLFEKSQSADRTQPNPLLVVCSPTFESAGTPRDTRGRHGLF